SGKATVNATTAACTGSSGSAAVYVAQNAAGSGDGSSCANAKPAAFFNTASNWGAGKPIAPGVVVDLCGTISSSLTVQGSGTWGSPISLLFQPGAKVGLPYCDPCLDISGRSYITIDGGGTSSGMGLSSAQGIIEATANGTNLANHHTGAAINASPCAQCEIKNLLIQNIYVHVPGSDPIDNSSENDIVFSGANVRIHDNTMHDSAWSLVYTSGDGAANSSTSIYNNNIYNVNHGIV